MSKNGPEAQAGAAFNTEASDEVRKTAKKTLNTMVKEYVDLNHTLSRVVRGDTKYSTAAPDKDMADKLTKHLQIMGFQIGVQTLVCARLDGVDVDGMIQEIDGLVQRQAPGAASLRR